MASDEKTLFAVSLLEEKKEKLGRLPLKSDFTPQEVCFIKQKLGPWPRALEAAGLKEAPLISSKEKNRIKHMRARQNRKLKRKSKEFEEE